MIAAKQSQRSLPCVSPGNIRLISVCPRLYADAYRQRSWKLLHGGGAAGRLLAPSGTGILGSVFQDQVAKPILLDLADPDSQLSSILQGRHSSAEELQRSLLQAFIQEYLANHLQNDLLHQGRRTYQISAYYSGLERLAEFIASFFEQASESPERQFPRFHKPEERIEGVMELPGVGSIQVAPTCDGLLFDCERGEFHVLEIKCKEEVELASDLNQLAAYAWMVHHLSGGIAVAGTLLFVGTESKLRHFPAAELRDLFPIIEKLARSVIEYRSSWGRLKRRMHVPATSSPSNCDRCTLCKKCEDIYGPRDEALKKVPT